MVKINENEDSKDIELLKKNYELIRKKYDLPEFKFMNNNFEIENTDPESELIIKIIRKHMTEKLFFVLRSLETFMNPQNAPLFIFNIIKLFNESEKELIRELYDKISVYEIEAFGLEAEYDEKKEIEFIKNICFDWQEISAGLKKLYASMKENNVKDSKKSEKSYFG